jgi:hypothetical protein
MLAYWAMSFYSLNMAVKERPLNTWSQGIARPRIGMRHASMLRAPGDGMPM